MGRAFAAIVLFCLLATRGGDSARLLSVDDTDPAVSPSATPTVGLAGSALTGKTPGVELDSHGLDPSNLTEAPNPAANLPPPGGSEALPNNSLPAQAPPHQPSNKPLDSSKEDVGEGGDHPKEPDAPPVDNTQAAAAAACGASAVKCRDDGNLVACLQLDRNDPNAALILVENTGVAAVVVDVKATPSLSANTKKLDIASGGSEKVKVMMKMSVAAVAAREIVLNAGRGDCVLRIQEPAFDLQQSFQQFTDYAAQLPPAYGVFVLGLAVLLAGGIWACCRRKKSGAAGSGVAYQQLEMAEHPTAVPSAESGATDGWDNNGWDDDWDEEEAPEKPGAGGNARSSRPDEQSKDGWDVDWDD